MSESPGRVERTPSVTLIAPPAMGAIPRIKEAWRYRGLVRYFGERAVDKVAKRTVLGRFWLLLKPLVRVGAQALVLGGLLGAPSSGLPYFMFFLTGMTAFQFFGVGLLWTTMSLELNQKILAKIYLPRLVLPLASWLPALYELTAYLVVLVLSIGVYSLLDSRFYLVLSPALLVAPLALLMMAALAFGMGLFTSVIGAYQRDMRYSVTLFTSFWMFATPVIYPLEVLPAPWDTIVALNPLTSVVELFRWSLFDAGQVMPVHLAGTFILIVIINIAGLRYFSRAEAAAIDRQ